MRRAIILLAYITFSYSMQMDDFNICSLVDEVCYRGGMSDAICNPKNEQCPICLVVESKRVSCFEVDSSRKCPSFATSTLNCRKSTSKPTEIPNASGSESQNSSQIEETKNSSGSLHGSSTSNTSSITPTSMVIGIISGIVVLVCIAIGLYSISKKNKEDIQYGYDKNNDSMNFHHNSMDSIVDYPYPNRFNPNVSNNWSTTKVAIPQTDASRSRRCESNPLPNAVPCSASTTALHPNSFSFYSQNSSNPEKPTQPSSELKQNEITTRMTIPSSSYNSDIFSTIEKSHSKGNSSLLQDNEVSKSRNSFDSDILTSPPQSSSGNSKPRHFQFEDSYLDSKEHRETISPSLSFESRTLNQYFNLTSEIGKKKNQHHSNDDDNEENYNNTGSPERLSSHISSNQRGSYEF